MNADGTDVRQLTGGNAENIHPTWSPGSTRILFNTTHFSGATAADGRDVPSANKVIGEKIDEKMDLAAIKPDGTGVKKNHDGGRLHLRRLFTGRELDFASPYPRRALANLCHEGGRHG